MLLDRDTTLLAGFRIASQTHVYRTWPTKESRKCWEGSAQRRLSSRNAISSTDRRLSSHTLDIPVHLEQVSIGHTRAVLHHDLALLVFDRSRKGVIRAVDGAGDDRVGLLAQGLRHSL